MAKVKHGIPSSQKPLIKRQLVLRDGCHCYICHEPLILVKATIDHMNNDNTDDYNELHNLRLCCEKCNSQKSLFECIIKGNKLIPDKTIIKMCQGYSYFNHIVKARHVFSSSYH